MSYFREITERYRIEKALSSQGPASVFRALDATTGEPVALKLIPRNGPPEEAQRFVRSMAALQGLLHPSLPAVVDFGFTPDGKAFLALEYVDGGGLDALAGGSPGQILPLLLQAASGLELLAGHGLAHHNLCPQNLLVVPGGDGGQVKMLGFGTALLRPEGAPAGGGSAPFLAPEVASVPAHADGRADLYSLALVACALLDLRVNGGDPATPRVSLPLGVSFELEDDRALQGILERCLRRDPGARPSFAEVQRSLRLAFAGDAGSPSAFAGETRLFLSSMPEEGLLAAVLTGAGESAGGQPAEPSARRDPGEDTHPVFPQEAAPRPATTPPRAELPAAAVPPPPVQPARPARRRWPLLVGAVAVLVMGGAALLWLLPHEELEAPPIHPANAGRRAAPVPPLPSLPPKAAATPSVGVPVAVPEKLVAASAAFAEDRDDVARQALAGITRDEEASYPAAACTRLLALGAALDASAGDRSTDGSREIRDLRASLKAGDLGPLRAAVRAIAPRERPLLRENPGLQKDLTTAKLAVGLQGRLEQAARDRDPAREVELAGELASLLPRSGGAAAAREKAAADLEGEAEVLFQTGEIDSGLGRLEALRRAWPDRPGLAERVARYGAEQKSDLSAKDVLAAATAAEARKRPHEGLALLRDARPGPRWEARFREAGKRLEGQLAELDKNPPAITVVSGAEFERGSTAKIALRVTDDYLVKSVSLRARAEGAGAFTDLAVRPSGQDYTVEVPEGFHQNRTIEFYAVATDLSGHRAELGSPQAPRQLKRRKWYEKLRPKPGAG